MIMISKSMTIGTSGLLAQKKLVDTISQNIANADVQGYKRQDAYTRSEATGGVTVSVSAQDQPWVDRNLKDASQDLAYQTAVKEGLEAVDSAMSSSSVEDSYNAFLTASKNVQANPSSPQYLAEFNEAGKTFNSTTENATSSLTNVQRFYQNKISLSQIELDSLKQQLTEISKNGISDANSSDVQFIKQRITTLSGSISGYTEVINSIMPPLLNTFKQNVSTVKNAVNESSGATMFSGDTWIEQTSVNAQAINNDSRTTQFIDNLGALKTTVGSKVNAAVLGVGDATSKYNAANKQYQDAYGVDLEQETLKLLQAQRLYEANAKVIQAADSMLGTLLNAIG